VAVAERIKEWKLEGKKAKRVSRFGAERNKWLN